MEKVIKKQRGIQPDLRINHVLRLKPEFLTHFQAILFDYDNTLAPWHGEISDEVGEWLRSLPCPALVLSNGHGNRVREAAGRFGIQARGDCFKPFTYRIRRYLQELEIDPGKCLLVGDNEITDIWTGNRLGCYTVRVLPQSDREYFLTRFWRLLEWLLDRRSR